MAATFISDRNLDNVYYQTRLNKTFLPNSPDFRIQHLEKPEKSQKIQILIFSKEPSLYTHSNILLYTRILPASLATSFHHPIQTSYGERQYILRHGRFSATNLPIQLVHPFNAKSN